MHFKVCLDLCYSFVFYTVSINVQFILEDKRTGVWNRLKLASVSKFQLYFGHLSFSYIIGLLQMMLVLFVFRYVLGTNMYGGFWKVGIIAAIYVLLVMAFSVFVISLVKTVSQSSIIISLVAVAFAMIGGAYWPLEIVQSEGITGDEMDFSNILCNGVYETSDGI